MKKCKRRPIRQKINRLFTSEDDYFDKLCLITLITGIAYFLIEFLISLL